MIFRGRGLKKEKNFNVQVNYILDNFLVQGAITLIYAPPKNSKSGLAMGILKHLLEKTSFYPCYLDFDNPIVSLADKEIDLFIEKYQGQFDYIHPDEICMEGHEALSVMVKDCKEDPKKYKNTVLFFDSATDFCDEGNDNSVKKFMHKLKILRNAGATIILLHHTNKTNGEYKGSSIFRSASDNVFSLTSEVINDNEDNILLESKNARFGKIRHSAFHLRKYSWDITLINYDDYCLPYHKREFIRDIRLSLKKAKAPLTQTKLLESINKQKDDKHSRELLNEFAGRYWEFIEKGKSKLYTLK